VAGLKVDREPVGLVGTLSRRISVAKSRLCDVSRMALLSHSLFGVTALPIIVDLNAVNLQSQHMLFPSNAN